MRKMEVTDAERNCIDEMYAGTGIWCRHSLLISSRELEASEKRSIAHAASAL